MDEKEGKYKIVRIDPSNPGSLGGHSQVPSTGYQLIIEPNGDRYYYYNRDCHRTNGPAIELANGYKEYCQNNATTRLDGPAKIWPNREKEYFINDVKYDEKSYWKKIYSTPEYIKKAILTCPFCDKKFKNNQEISLHLDQEEDPENDDTIKDQVKKLEKREIIDKLLEKPIIQERLNLMKPLIRNGTSNFKLFKLFANEEYDGKYKVFRPSYVDGIYINDKTGNGYEVVEQRGESINYLNNYSNTCKNYYFNKKLHKIDGPAKICASGAKEWYFYGNKIDCTSQKQFNRIVLYTCPFCDKQFDYSHKKNLAVHIDQEEDPSSNFNLNKEEIEKIKERNISKLQNPMVQAKLEVIRPILISANKNVLNLLKIAKKLKTKYS